MRYYLSENAVLKSLETPSVYDISNDELFELDQTAFDFLLGCSGASGGAPAEADPAFLEYCVEEGLLQDGPVKKKRAAVVHSPVPSLRYLELQITDRCNLRCMHCYLGSPQNIEIPLEQLQAVLKEFECMQGLRLLITGGEPLLHSRFRDFNAMLPDYEYRKILLTNGMLLDRTAMKALNVHEIQFSVDGMERGHDAMRGGGTYRKVIEKIEMAVDLGLAVSVATMVHGENLDEFDDMCDLFLSLGIKDWSVDIPCSEGRLRYNNNLMVPPETGGRFLSYGFGNGLHGSAAGYGCGLHLAAVIANGEVCKCAFYKDSPAGRITGGLAAAWANIAPVRLSALECAARDCAFLEECRGGCRYRAARLAGSADKARDTDGSYAKGRDFYKCFYYGIMK